MNKNATSRAFAALIGLTLVTAPALVAQDMPFHKYVALGDSITASFQGLCLVQRHQVRSYPNVIAAQLGITDFQQPIFVEKALSTDPTKNKCLGFVVVGSSIGVGAVSDQIGPTPTTLALPRPYDNLAIVGAASFDLVDLKSADPAGNTANKFAFAVLRNNFPGSPLNGTSAVDQANLLQPDLVTLFIGADDVLGALLDAILVDGVNTTPVAFFQAKYAQVVNGLVATGRTLVILNIPSLNVLPFATTLPTVVLDPSTNQPALDPDGNPIPLLGPGNAAYPCPGGAAACPLPAGTLVTLGAQSPQAILGGKSLLQLGFGIPCVGPFAALPRCGFPLPDGTFIPPSTISPGVLLYPNESAFIEQRIQDLNALIASIGGGAGAILVDAYALLNQIKAQGYSLGGVTMTTTFGTGGLFSADGFHPSSITHSIIADVIIQAINAAKGTSIPRPDFSSVLFTPDLPPPPANGGAVVDAGPLWEGRQLLEIFRPANMQLLDFDLYGGPHRPRGGRTIVVGDRPGGEAKADGADRNQ